MVLLLALPAELATAANPPRLTRLAREARIVAAGRVVSIFAHDDGRLHVADFEVDRAMKGSRVGKRLSLVEGRDLPTPPMLVAPTYGVVFLRRAGRTSYLSRVLPAGIYYEPLPTQYAVLTASSPEEGKEIATLVQRLMGARPDPKEKRMEPAERARETRRLTFDLLGARHRALVEEGAARLSSLGSGEPELSDRELATLDEALGRSDLPERVRKRLIRAVARARIAQAVPSLRRIDSPPAVMEEAWRALDRLGAPPDPDRLAEQLASPEPAVRAAAARELLRREGVGAIPRAQPLALQDGDESVRLAVVEALGALGKPEALPSLERVFAENDGRLQQAAGRAILAVGGEAAAEALERLAFSAPSGARRYAVVLLMTMNDDQKASRVERIAREHPDEGIRELVTHGVPVHHH